MVTATLLLNRINTKWKQRCAGDCCTHQVMWSDSETSPKYAMRYDQFAALTIAE